MELSDIILYYFLFTLLVAINAYFRFKVRDGESKLKQSTARLGRCTKCQRIFLIPRQSPVARCPHCNGTGTIYSE